MYIQMKPGSNESVEDLSYDRFSQLEHYSYNLDLSQNIDVARVIYILTCRTELE